MKTLKFANGIKYQVQSGRYVCDRFEGQFMTKVLQNKADTGLWFARATGTGLGIEGSGQTPEMAMSDMKKRAAQTREELERVYGLEPSASIVW